MISKIKNFYLSYSIKNIFCKIHFTQNPIFRHLLIDKIEKQKLQTSKK